LKRNELTAVEKQVPSLAEQATGITIHSDEDYGLAAEFLRSLKSMQKKVKETFAPIKQAQDEAKKKTLEKERELLTPLTEAEKYLKDRMGSYLTEVRQAQEAALEAARVEASKNTRFDWEEVPTVLPPSIQPPKAAGISTKTVWKYRIVNPDLIAREFLVPDEQKIGKVVKAMGMDAVGVVGAIEVWPETSIGARSDE